MARKQTIVVDTAPLEKAAARIGRTAQKHVPDATAKALTITAARARKAERARMKRKLDRPKPFTIDSTAYNPAKRKGDYFVADVYVKPQMQEILSRLEYGGVVAFSRVPDESVQDQWGGLGLRGGQKLLSQPGVFEATIKNTRGIFMRDPGGRRGHVKLLVAYHEDTRYKPQLGFNDEAYRVGLSFQDEAVHQLELLMGKDAQ